MVLGFIVYLVPLTLGGVICYFLAQVIIKIIGKGVEGICEGIGDKLDDEKRKHNEDLEKAIGEIRAKRLKREALINDSIKNKETPKYLEVSQSACEPVDMGLPSGTLWGSCNIGATEPEVLGDAFAWGETRPKSEYTEKNSVHFGIPLNIKDKDGYEIDNIAGSEFDAATTNLGEGWAIPNDNQFKELIEICQTINTTKNGVQGLRVISPNGNSLFFPYVNSEMNTNVHYMNASIHKSAISCSTFRPNGICNSSVVMGMGLYVRPIYKKKQN